MLSVVCSFGSSQRTIIAEIPWTRIMSGSRCWAGSNLQVSTQLLGPKMISSFARQNRSKDHQHAPYVLGSYTFLFLPFFTLTVTSFLFLGVNTIKFKPRFSFEVNYNTKKKITSSWLDCICARLISERYWKTNIYGKIFIFSLYSTQKACLLRVLISHFGLGKEKCLLQANSKWSCYTFFPHNFQFCLHFCSMH